MLPTEELDLKCGKNIFTPSFFLNPQTKSEAKLMKGVVLRYPTNEKYDGVNQIDGLVVSIKDWEKISPLLLRKSLREAFGKEFYSVKDRVFIIDPSLYLPFMGLKTHKEDFCEAVEWIPQLRGIIERISVMKSQKDKIDSYMNDIYPLLDVRVIQRFLEYQIRNRTDILVSPSVPLTSPRVIANQTEKMGEMNRESRILLDTVFSKYKDQRDLMNMTALNPSVLIPEYLDVIRDAIFQGKPDLVGIRVMNLDEDKTPEIETLLKFIRGLTLQKVPIFVFNVREFGYVAFHHGVSAISMPIAKSPYTVRSKGGERPPRKGKYYHPIDLVDYGYNELRGKTRPHNYRLPCHCEICDSYESFSKADESGWNKFRKIHFLLVKNMEIREFREAEVSLGIALKDKFARSKKTGWVSFLD